MAITISRDPVDAASIFLTSITYRTAVRCTDYSGTFEISPEMPVCGLASSKF